jgi:hypothetical protein
MDKVKSTPCRIAIQKTLAYSGVFKYPLTYFQLTSRLISKDNFSGKQIRKDLKKQIKDNLIDKVEEKEDKHLDKYVLHDVKPVSWDERRENTKKILKRNEKALEYIARVPWIKMMAITGSAANYNMEEKADIDLLFITNKDRVWITRGFVFLILAIINKLPKKHENREICPNIFIDETRLAWIKKRRNLYVAQNIISMQPILSKDDIYFRFMYENRWIKNYYHNFKINYPEKFRELKSSRSLFMNLIEKLFMLLQLTYMKRKMTTEIATSRLIHFNKNDNSRWILKSYKNLLKNN